jgi:hypothetical protein
MQCTNCGGLGHLVVTCEDCKGSGVGDDGNACQTCQGQGSYGVICDVCNGTGEVDDG